MKAALRTRPQVRSSGHGKTAILFRSVGPLRPSRSKTGANRGATRNRTCRFAGKEREIMAVSKAVERRKAFRGFESHPLRLLARGQCRQRERPASDYAVTRSPDAADLSMAAMTSWRRTAPAKSGTA